MAPPQKRLGTKKPRTPVSQPSPAGSPQRPPSLARKKSSESSDTRFQPDTPSASRYQGLPVYARLVLDVVDTIPSGRVMAYGDIAEYLEQGGPRLVARMMALYGSEVPWHRVLRADGTCASEVADRQYPLLHAEGVPFTKGGRVAIEAARWIPIVDRPT